jgi:hypothetical protein
MSESQHPTEHRTRAEPDRIASGRIVLVGVASLILFFLASVASTWMLSARRAEVNPEGPPALPGEAGKPKIGVLEQQLFENTRTAERWREEALRRLGSHGWVDRKAGVIHLPVEEAMDRVARGERP